MERKNNNKYVRSEVFTSATMKNAVFRDVAPCRYLVNRRFGGTYRLHLQHIRNPQAMNQREQVAVDYVPLKRQLTKYLHDATSQMAFLNNKYVQKLNMLLKVERTSRVAGRRLK
jgi:hypothetical protein